MALTFYHSPNTRSSGALVLLEELGVEYTLHPLNMAKGEQRAPEYLAVNPMGKVPAIVHDGALVTEQVAVFAYLADAFPAAGLAPPIGDPLRGPYLRWLAFYGAAFEPAVLDRSMQRDPGAARSSPYGDFATVWRAVTDQFSTGPYMLGERFTAADLLWSTALIWTTRAKMVPDHGAIAAYAARVAARPAMARVRAIDKAIMAEQAG
ncbi:MAG: glutathione S-transferase [Gemmatimonadaceae bacterium]|nr:glutathione S-transferase [Acetobacteraceae bacterium]